MISLARNWMTLLIWAGIITAAVVVIRRRRRAGRTLPFGRNKAEKPTGETEHKDGE